LRRRAREMGFDVAEFFAQLTDRLNQESPPADDSKGGELPEAVQKAIEDIGNMAQAMELLRTAGNERQATLDQVTDVLEKILDRVASLETGTAVRKSMDGGEVGDDGKPVVPTIQGAVLKALSRRPVYQTR
jgi:two-component sensor histidine kinase